MNLKYLSKLILLGCANIKDEGLKEISRSLKYLEEIDIGGTQVTGDGLREIVNGCINIRRINIAGCKKLNASDDNILKMNK